MILENFLLKQLSLIISVQIVIYKQCFWQWQLKSYEEQTVIAIHFHIDFELSSLIYFGFILFFINYKFKMPFKNKVFRYTFLVLILVVNNILFLIYKKKLDFKLTKINISLRFGSVRDNEMKKGMPLNNSNRNSFTHIFE